jgi:hypothetical protein
VVARKKLRIGFALSGDPRYKHTFLDYDRPFDPFPIHFRNANPGLQIAMKKQRKRTVSPC